MNDTGVLPRSCLDLPDQVVKSLLALHERLSKLKWMDGPRDEKHCVALLQQYFSLLDTPLEDGRSSVRTFLRGEHLFNLDDKDYERFDTFGVKWVRDSWEDAIGWKRHCYLRGNVARLSHLLDYVTELSNMHGRGTARHDVWDYFGQIASESATEAVRDGVWFSAGAAAAWTVISDLTSRESPFEPLLGIWEQGVWPIGHVHSYQDDFILFVPRVAPVKVFISYKWEDEKRNKWVEDLYLDLRYRGVDAKLDKYDVPPGGSFTQYMTSKIAECDKVLFIITPASVDAANQGQGAVAFETQLANAIRISEDRGAFIVPILREGNYVPDFLRDRRALDFRNAAEYYNGLMDLGDWLTGKAGPPALGQRPRTREIPSGSGPDSE